MAVIAVYLAINIVVVTICAGYGIDSCAFLREASQPFSSIPAIKRPVEFLIATGNPDRAAVVAGLYAFGWLTAFIAIAAMIGSAAVISVRTSEEQRRRTKRVIEKLAEEYLRFSLNSLAASGRPESRESLFVRGSVVVVGGALMSFSYVFWGYYSFDEWSAYSNMVHVRDRDFYLMSIGWSFALTFTMLVIMGAIQRFVLRQVQPVTHRS
jgi:hypothetical protein